MKSGNQVGSERPGEAAPMPRTALAGSTYSPKRPLRCAAVARVAVDAADPRWHGAPVYPRKLLPKVVHQ
jgi:hypothetical protein